MQLVFLQEELIPRLEEAREGTRRVFFVDAAHFVLGAFLGMIWCLTRVLVRTGSGRQRYSVLGAVETRDHDLVSIRTTGSVNAQTVCELIEKISQEYPGEEITLVMDNARYQRNADVFECAARNGIELLFLPAYSPNLNLIERVWRLLKSRTLRNKYFPDFATFRGGIDAFLDSLSGTNRHLLKSLVTENFQTFEIPNL
jgi:transposase